MESKHERHILRLLSTSFVLLQGFRCQESNSMVSRINFFFKVFYSIDSAKVSDRFTLSTSFVHNPYCSSMKMWYSAGRHNYIASVFIIIIIIIILELTHETTLYIYILLSSWVRFLNGNKRKYEWVLKM